MSDRLRLMARTRAVAAALLVLGGIFLMGLGTAAFGQYGGSDQQGDLTIEGQDRRVGATVFLVGDGYNPLGLVEVTVRESHPGLEPDPILRFDANADAGGAVRIPLLLASPLTVGQYQLEVAGATGEGTTLRRSWFIDIEPGPEPEPLLCKGQEATHPGTDGDDIINGTAGPDVIVGLAGNDRINGLGGDDLICAGPGADVVKGGGGKDRVYGQGGNDKLRGNGGKDRLYGGGGKDNIKGGGAADRLFGGGKRDIIKGGSGNDRIRGNGGNDTLRGQAGTDNCKGGAGTDRVFGCE
jgi:Ca2+-binding RTX toxin-like protein